MAGWCLSTLAMVLLGCPGTLDDPDRFRAAVCGGPGQPSCTASVSVPLQVLKPKCGTDGCHAATNPQSGLDLASPDVARRLEGKTSSTSFCGGRSYLVPGDPEESLIYDKLLPAPKCGGRMPPTRDPLPASDVTAVRAWIEGML